MSKSTSFPPRPSGSATPTSAAPLTGSPATAATSPTVGTSLPSGTRGADSSSPPSQKAEEVAKTAADQIHQGARTAKASAENMLAEGQAAADQKKQSAGDQLCDVGESLKSAAQNLEGDQHAWAAQAINSAGEQLSRLGDYVRQRNYQELMQDAKQYARQHPEVFYLGLFAAGVGFSQFLKSSTAKPIRDAVSEEAAAATSNLR